MPKPPPVWTGWSTRPVAIFTSDETLAVDFPVKSWDFLHELLLDRSIVAFNRNRRVFALDNGTVISAHLDVELHEESALLPGRRAIELEKMNMIGEMKIISAYVGGRLEDGRAFSVLYVCLEKRSGDYEWLPLLSASNEAGRHLGQDAFAQRLNYATADRILAAAEREASNGSL